MQLEVSSVQACFRRYWRRLRWAAATSLVQSGTAQYIPSRSHRSVRGRTAESLQNIGLHTTSYSCCTRILTGAGRLPRQRKCYVAVLIDSVSTGWPPNDVESVSRFNMKVPGRFCGSIGAVHSHPDALSPSYRVAGEKAGVPQPS
jgi:hypothetical protein